MAVDGHIITNRYAWTIRQGIRVAGHAWTDQTLIENEQLIDRIAPFSESFQEFLTVLSVLNGQYTVIIARKGEIWVHCSHTWSYPLFYTLAGKKVIVSDNPEEISKYLPDRKLHHEAKPYFLSFGVTPGAATLLENIRQVLPGETIRFNLAAKKHENHRLRIIPGEGRLSDETEAAGVIRRSFLKYAGYLRDKKVLLPLTSGYDSRLMACLLRESGHPRVTCATWGRFTGSERITAEKVAKWLNFHYIFVPYPLPETRDWLRDRIFRDYISYSGHFSSMPYLQDYFAIRHLINAGVIDQETVVLPGHPGDFLRGAHLYPSLPYQKPSETVRSIISLFGTSYPLKKK